MRSHLNHLLCGLLMLAGCKGCDDDPSPKANADFEVGQMLGYGNDFPFRFIANDTIETLFGWGNPPFPPYGVTVHFKAKDSTMDQYEWKIGTDDRTFTKRLFGLDFKMPGTYPVKLKVYKKAGSTTLVDSVTKSFIMERRPLPRLYGKWRGSLSFKPDSIFDIWICLSNQQLEGDQNWMLDTSYIPFNENGFFYTHIYKFLTPYYSDQFRVDSKMGDKSQIQFFQSSWFGKNLYFTTNNSFDKLRIELQLQRRWGSVSTPYMPVIFTGNRIK